MIRRIQLLVFALLILPVSIWAQEPASSFAQLRSRLQPGDTLDVTDPTGLRLHGKLRNISSSSLTLSLGGRTREFAEADVRTIRAQQNDSLRNGTLIGLGAGVGAGFLTIPLTCNLPDKECATIAGVVLVPLGAAIGALSGALIDRILHKSSTVYRSAVASRTALSFSPLLGTGRRGLSLAIRF